MKIVWVIKGNEGFGIARATISLAQKLRENGHEIVFICFSEGNLSSKIKGEGFVFEKYNIINSDFYNQNLLFFLKRIFSVLKNALLVKNCIKKSIRKHEPEYLIYRAPDLTLPISFLKHEKLKKYWIMPNEISSSYFLNINKHLYQFVIRLGGVNVIANSKYTASTIDGFGIKSKVLYLGVDTKKFDPFVKRPLPNLALKGNEFVFGVFARFHELKAQDIIIKAFSKLMKNRLPCKLLLVGLDKNNDFSKYCIKVAEKEGVMSNVIFVETVNNIEDYYQLVDVVINSRRDAEPFGLTVVEAMLMRKPVLAYGKGGPSETIIDGTTGWLINEPTVDGYFRGMMKVIDNRYNLNSMGEKAMEHAKKNFSSDSFYKNFLQILN